MSFSIYLPLIALAIIQGITEWLPISSSGILVFLEQLINLEDKNLNLLFNISVHAGSLIAIIFYFKKEILNILKNLKLLQNIIIATIPVVLFGLIVKVLNLNIFLQDIKVVAFATVFFSIILYLSDKTKVTQRYEQNIPNKNAFYIGLAQVLALIPGTSRSGITITCARYLGYSRTHAAKFSFIISIPVLLAATTLGAVETITNLNSQVINILLIGFSFSLIASLLSIKVFLSFVENNSLTLFVILRLILGAGLLFYSFS
ncbi:undecaprenyl-diphosphate phosphatase [Candidatus Pelagibacter sp. HIMB1517]|uniref:undecaprenyl-diphosphate phosphatase n=1 Tax=Candidatus Pelagibacter sp. HIMB1517 TaxID=3413341 RepID=UPI003F87BF31